MTTEELIKPRYKVIADYPGNPFLDNHVYTPEFIMSECYDIKEAEDIEKYPSIFQKLQWWEERQPEEMPKYVKDKSSPKVFRVLNKSHDFQIWHHDNSIEFRFVYPEARWFLPATEEEYNKYVNQKQQPNDQTNTTHLI